MMRWTLCGMLDGPTGQPPLLVQSTPTFAGMAHEAANLLFDRHPVAESLMDIHNSNEGVEAVRERRAIDKASLQNKPQSLRAAAARGYPHGSRQDSEARYPARQYRTYPPYRWDG